MSVAPAPSRVEDADLFWNTTGRKKMKKARAWLGFDGGAVFYSARNHSCLSGGRGQITQSKDGDQRGGLLVTSDGMATLQHSPSPSSRRRT